MSMLIISVLILFTTIFDQYPYSGGIYQHLDDIIVSPLFFIIIGSIISFPGPLILGLILLKAPIGKFSKVMHLALCIIIFIVLSFLFPDTNYAFLVGFVYNSPIYSILFGTIICSLTTLIMHFTSILKKRQC